MSKYFLWLKEPQGLDRKPCGKGHKGSVVLTEGSVYMSYVKVYNFVVERAPRDGPETLWKRVARAVWVLRDGTQGPMHALEDVEDRLDCVGAKSVAKIF